MLQDKILYRHRRPTGNPLDKVVCTAKQAIIHVNGGFTQMLACM